MNTPTAESVYAAAIAIEIANPELQGWTVAQIADELGALRIDVHNVLAALIHRGSVVVQTMTPYTHLTSQVEINRKTHAALSAIVELGDAVWHAPGVPATLIKDALAVLARASYATGNSLPSIQDLTFKAIAKDLT